MARSVAIADGLAAAHAKGTVHRDLKPQNIFLTADAQVKILDFGIARVHCRATPLAQGVANTETQFTAAGILVGSPPYMSPEQLRGEPAEAFTDIFSFGCVLYEMITRRRPFARANMAETIAAVLDGNPPPPMGEAIAGMPTELERLIRDCLRPRPEERPHSAHDVACRLRAILNGAPAGTPPRPVRTGRTRGFAAAVALGCVVAAIAVWRSVPEIRPRPAESLAILPVANETGNPNLEYLSDGISESLINTLSQAPRLKIIARTTAFRYKGQRLDPAKTEKSSRSGACSRAGLSNGAAP